MTSTGKRHTARYTPGQHGQHGDERLHSDIFHRNGPPIIAALGRFLSGRTGSVLELGAGTGQHAIAFAQAFPTLNWVASDPFEDHRASIVAWAHALLPDQAPPLKIDAATDWAAQADVQALAPLTGLYAGNVTHIAPWAVTEGIFRGAGKTLGPGGRLFLYGPFRDGGAFFGEGNRNFDADLRADNPDWGLRDIAVLRELARAEGLAFEEAVEMPANNRLLVVGRAEVSAGR